jgi:hypothetical protein
LTVTAWVGTSIGPTGGADGDRAHQESAEERDQMAVDVRTKHCLSPFSPADPFAGGPCPLQFKSRANCAFPPKMNGR